MAHINDEKRAALELGPWDQLEMRYLRKAVRYRLNGQTVALGSRTTPPSGRNTSEITLERRKALDVIASWIVQEEC